MNFLKPNRRQFLTGMLTASITLGVSQTAEPAKTEKTQEYYELRVYRITDAENQKMVSDYLDKALLPALKRLGINHVGVFKEIEEKGDYSLYVTIPFTSLNEFSCLNNLLENDVAYQEAAKVFFALSKVSPVYRRIESQLMKAITSSPVLQIPQKKPPHLFELRTYESPNARMGRLTVDMFNEGKLADIMREVKLGPVFFGEMLIGDNVPNLTYMLAAKNITEHDEHWKSFRAHPKWSRVKRMKKYQDTISKIKYRYLSPLEYSGIQ